MRNVIDEGCGYNEGDISQYTAELLETIEDGVDDIIDGVVNELYSTDEDRKEAKDTAWEIIPIVLSILLVAGIVATTICCMQGWCCTSFY